MQLNKATCVCMHGAAHTVFYYYCISHVYKCCVFDNVLCYTLPRPVAGYLNVCPNLLINAPAAYDSLLSVVMHELFHMLVRNDHLICKQLIKSDTVCIGILL